MRALVIGAAPCDDAGVALVASLAASADLVVAADGGGEHCLRAGIVPDVVVGDLDSLDRASATALEERGARVIGYPADKDVTDLDLAISLARERGANEVTLTCVTGGRLDHSLSTMGSLLCASDLRIAVREPDLTVRLADADKAPDVDVAGEGTRFSVLALGGAAVVSVSGARWPLDRAEIAPLSSHGLSNVVSGSAARVTAHTGVVGVITDGRP